MPRPQLAIGDYGHVSYSVTAGGLHVALARFRDMDGETRRVSAQGKSKSGAAAALRTKFKERAAAGELSSESRVTSLAERYWTAKQDDNLAPNTRYNLRRALDNHVIPRIGKLRIREATPQRLDKAIRDITKEHGPGTARVVRSALSGMFAAAVRWGAAGSNPVTFTPVPKMEPKAVRALTAPELWLMRQHAVKVFSPPSRRAGPGPMARDTLLDMMDFLLATGCRAGEVPGLAWEDVHLDDPVPWVEIRQQVVKVAGEGLLLTPTKERDVRRLRLPAFAVEMLRRREALAEDVMVFPSTRGSLMSPTSIATSWREMFKGSDWAWVTQKTLRKTVATLIDAELGSVVASKQLGHASDAVTRAHYIAQSMTPLDVGTVLELDYSTETRRFELASETQV